ncbi:hypothetical protein OUZ56_013110 [Daphnia magna]|uniref:GMPS ATP-PPase domain-containing protein n=1 Tax=Daphnia magna TaxID=35525 RepID=A0ABQ9Z4X2_9CRUS|nr:hypothetical protein OUZ56_013110 [Daphnia magna]
MYKLIPRSSTSQADTHSQSHSPNSVKRMTQYTTQQPLLVVFQCREFVVRASTQQGISSVSITSGAIHIDNGFLRKDESEQIDTSLHQLGLNLRVIKASLTFYDASTNVHVADRTANDLNLTWDNLFLGQGTLRPDLIESASHRASSRADTIKNHHSDFEMVRQLRLHGRVVEPFKGHCIEMFPAFWHSIRSLGRELRLPAELLERHPFPGPSLSIRILYVE